MKNHVYKFLKRIVYILSLSAACILFFYLIQSGNSNINAAIIPTDDQAISQKLTFRVQTDFALRNLNSKFCWFHPRVAAIPGYGQNGMPAVIMTIQKHLVVSDFYSGMYYMRTDDLGKTWTGPVEIPELAWQYEADGTTVSVADVTPAWHKKTGKLIAIGIKVRYSKEGKQLLDKSRSHDAAYAVFDPETKNGPHGKWLRMCLSQTQNFILLIRVASSGWLSPMARSFFPSISVVPGQMNHPSQFLSARLMALL